MGTAAWIALMATGIAVASLSGYLVAVVDSTPGVAKLHDARAARPSRLVTADGQSLGLFQRERQERVSLAAISPYVIHALIATEDRRFREHMGIDFKRLFIATFHTATGNTQGGSTLTQQLARNMFPDEIGRARSLHRKTREIITALRIERELTKDQILETYLNTVPFFYNVVGIEMAARTYYGVAAKELDELQSATLVGMLKGTQYYNPVRHPERAFKRRNVVLTQMYKQGVLTTDRFHALTARPLQIRFNRQPEVDIVAPHFAARTRQWAIEWAQANGYDLYSDGLVIETTLDPSLQEAAARAVTAQSAFLQKVADVEWSHAALRSTKAGAASHEPEDRVAEPFAYFWKLNKKLLATFVRDTPEYERAVKGGSSDAQALHSVMSDAEVISRVKRERTRLEAGFVAIDPSNGEVKAWVGSRDFETDQYDHVAQAARQPGSTFKPFVYGAALESGIEPDRTFLDAPVEVLLENGSSWRPTDMSGTSGQPVTLRDGLVYSKNTITVQVMQRVGVYRTVALARALGVTDSKLYPVPSLALGTSPVTLLEMVNAYASIARVGLHHAPVLVRQITDRDGSVIATFKAEASRAMSADAAVELIDMMRGVIARGTGTQVRTRFGLIADLAGKTGTTQNNTDGWFILMHPQLVAGAWVGFNDARITMRSTYWGQGGHNAIFIVGDFFRTALKRSWVDATASFPASRRPPPPPPPITPRLPDEEWVAVEDSDEPEPPAPLNTIPPNTATTPNDPDPLNEEPTSPAQLDGFHVLAPAESVGF